MRDGYTAFVIDEESRRKLLQTFPPKYPDVIAHHITHGFGVSDKEPLPPQPQKVLVHGYHDSGAIQVLVVEVDGRKNQGLQTDKFYHVTLSLERAQGVTPRNSNDVLQKIVAGSGEGALRNLSKPIEISVTPVFIKDEPVTPRKTKIPQPKL
jgi:hypothetical protein